MIISGPQLGFSITSFAKDVGHGIVSVASNKNVQQAAAAAAQAYAPNQYNQATYWADRARGIIRPSAPGAPPPMPMPPPAPPPPPPGPDGGDDDGAPIGPQHVEKNKMLPWIIIGGGGILLLLLLKR